MCAAKPSLAALDREPSATVLSTVGRKYGCSGTVTRFIHQGPAVFCQCM